MYKLCLSAMYKLCLSAAAFTVLAACHWLTENRMLVPAELDWEADVVQVVLRLKWWFIVPGVLYVPSIFGLQRWMETRKPFDLGGPGSKAAINYIFWHEAILAVFSILGAMHAFPLLLGPVWRGESALVDQLCVSPHTSYVRNDPRAIWSLWFAYSKVYEFADTLFIVLRKKKLVLLQWYHHFCTMISVAGGIVFICPFSNVGGLCSALNLSVHAIMYTWYAATRLGWKSPKAVMMFVTFVQLSQMFIALAWTLMTSSERFGPNCGAWAKGSPCTLVAFWLMYASYALLFGKLFHESYIMPKPKRVKTA